MVGPRAIRASAILLVLVALAPTARAAEDGPVESASVDRVVETVEDLVSTGASAATGAAAAAPAAAGAASDGGRSFLALLAEGAAAFASATAEAASGAVRALVAGGDLALAAFAALGAGLASAFRVAGVALAVAGRAALHVLGAAFVLLGSLLSDGARFVADHPRETLLATASIGGVAAAAGLLAWLKRLGVLAPLAGLYTRIAKGEILDNGVRATVFAEVRDNPGIHPSALKGKLGIGWGTIVYHLDRLEEVGLVTSRRGSGQKCYFVNGGAIPPAAQKAAAAIKHPSAHAIAEYVRGHPATPQKAVGETLGMSPALVSWHVKRLVAAGVLAQERTSRGVVLRLAPGSAPALAVA